MTLALITTWKKLQDSGLVIDADTMLFDERYAWIGSDGRGNLERWPGWVWFFSDLGVLRKAAPNLGPSPSGPLFQKGEQIVTAVTGRPICTENHPRRCSAVEFGLAPPNEVDASMNRQLRWLCVPPASLSLLTYSFHVPCRAA